MTETLTLNGVPVDTYALMLTDMSGIMVSPGRRGSNVVVPGRHGVIRTPQKRFDAAELILPLWVNGCLPDGSIPVDSTARREFFKRRNELLLLLYSDPLILEYTRADGHAVSAAAEVVEVLDFAQNGIDPEAQVSVALTLPGAFWQDSDSVSQTVTGATGTEQELTAFAGATAPMAELTLTFNGPVNNPQVAAGDRWVKYADVISSGRQLVLNTGSWTLGPGTGSAWTPDPRKIQFGPGPTWWEINPGVGSANFTHTGGGSASMTIAGRRKYLMP